MWNNMHMILPWDMFVHSLFVMTLECVYIYIYIYNNSPYIKKNPASDLKMKIYNESLSRVKKLYILEKKKKGPTLSYQLKKIKIWLVKRKKKHRSGC